MSLDEMPASERASIRETLCLALHAFAAAQRLGHIGTVRGSDIANVHRLIDWASSPAPSEEPA